MADEAQVRTCAKCGVEDTEAHHIHYVAFNHPVDGSPQDLSISKHIQCCAEDGCEICTTQVAHATQAGTETAPGPAFTAFVQDPPDALNQELFEKHAVETPNYNIPATGDEPSSEVTSNG